MKNAYISNLVMVVVTVLLAAVLIIGDLLSDSSAAVPSSEVYSNDHHENEFSYTVSPAQISEETTKLLQAVSRGSVYVFDVEGVEDSVISVWLEQYAKGEKLPNLFGPMSTRFFGNEDKGQVVFDFHYKSDSNNEEKDEELSLTTSIMFDGGMSQSYNDISLAKTEMKNWSPLNEAREIPRGQPVTVIMVLEKNGDQMLVISDWAKLYDVTGVLPEELNDYDRVVFFRITVEDNAEDDPSHG